MCGRYVLQSDPVQLAGYYDTDEALPNFAPCWNVAPTLDMPVVRRHPETGRRSLDLLRWGLVPRWAKDPSGGARLMNARADGVADKPSFREAFARRRCLVPADAFYEWRDEGARTKQPYAAALATGEPMTLAGIWEGWKAPDGTWLRTYSIVTTDAHPRLTPLHHRMPVILPRASWSVWLGDTPAGREDLLALLQPFDAAAMSIWPVDRRVNKVAENDAALLRRTHDTAPPEGLDDPPPAWALSGADRAQAVPANALL